MLTIRARRYDTGEPIELTVEGNRITGLRPAWPRGDVAAWPYVGPALFDLQVNGYGGVWFSSETLTVDDVAKALEPLPQYGLTRICPTLVTNSAAALEHGFATIRAACEREPWIDRMVAGCHLEGPWISPVDGYRGAHAIEHARGVDGNEWERWQAASGNRIVLVTLAPEVPGALEFIGRVAAEGVRVSLGHTAATAAEIRAAAEAGASLSTHLGNGIATTLHRHGNPIWPQLADDRLWTSLITDGFHVPPDFINTVLAVKKPRRTILTCDAAGWAGCPPGRYESVLGTSELLEDGRLVVAGQRELLAGSAQMTTACLEHVLATTACPLGPAVDMASRNPAKLLGRPVTRLGLGGFADLFVFHWERGPQPRVRVTATITGGRVAFGQLPEVD